MKGARLTVGIFALTFVLSALLVVGRLARTGSAPTGAALVTAVVLLAAMAAGGVALTFYALWGRDIDEPPTGGRPTRRPRARR